MEKTQNNIESLPSHILEKIVEHTTPCDAVRFLATSKTCVSMSDVVEQKVKDITKKTITKIVENVLEYDALFGETTECENLMKSIIKKFYIMSQSLRVEASKSTLDSDKVTMLCCCELLWKQMQYITGLDRMWCMGVVRQLIEYSVSVVVNMQFPPVVHAPVLYEFLKAHFINEERIWKLSSEKLPFELHIAENGNVLLVLPDKTKYENIESVIKNFNAVKLIPEKDYYFVLCLTKEQESLTDLVDIIHHLFGNGLFLHTNTIDLNIEIISSLHPKFVKHTTSVCGELMKKFEQTHFKATVQI
jgi:hypothetical protein